MIKGHIFGQTRASHAMPKVIHFFSKNASESSCIISEDKNIVKKAYSMEKVGSGGNFDSGKLVNGKLG